jgi:hypothetical protein
MSTTTDNYNLTLPDASEDYSISVFNNNFIAIDTALKALADLFSDVIKFTPEGGIAFRMINKTGAASVKGSMVAPASAITNGFVLQSSEFDTIGAVYEDGIADGELCWVVKLGTAEVLLEDGTDAAAGNWVRASDVDGRADASLAQPPGNFNTATVEHFKEVGHCQETKAAGTNVLVKINLHLL